MADIVSLQLSFTRGELTPFVRSRVDIEDYRFGLAYCQNWQVMKYGGLTRTPGTLDQNPLANSGAAKGRLIRFLFNQDTAYALEFTDLKIRVHTVDGRVGTVEVTSPYVTADLWKIRATAIGDVVYLDCDGYEPRTLTREAAEIWTLATFSAGGGPWLIRPDATTTLTLADTANPVPIMTGNSAPSGTASKSSGGGTSPYLVFDRDPETSLAFANGGSGYVEYDFGSGVERTIDAYSLQAGGETTQADEMCISWKLLGQKDGSSDWVILDAHRDTSDWLSGEIRHFEISNKDAFRKYRYAGEGGERGSTNGPIISNIYFRQAASEQTAFNCTASAVTGINNDTGFQTTDVGRLIRYMGSDGFFRWLEIVSRTSTTVVTVKMHGPPLLDLDATSVWQLGAWSDETGWPAVNTRYKGRLVKLRNTAMPLGVWLSVANDFDNMGTSQPTLLDDDAISLELDDGELDIPLWASTNGDDLLIGTAGGVRILSKRSSTDPLSPSNIESQGRTDRRAGDVEPVWIDRIMVFADRQRKTLVETAFSLDEGGYVTRELSMLAEHLFQSKVREIHYQMTPTNILWAVMEDGSLLSCTYDRQQRVFGVTRVVMPGTGVTVESMCILPGDDYDVPLLVVGREVDGSTTYRIEKMLDPYVSGVSSYDIPVYLASAARYTGVAASTITGLSHLEGESVAVYTAAGKDLGDATVTSGQITVPGGGTVTDALVGLRMVSKFTLLKPPNLTERGAFLFSRIRVSRMIADLFETYGLEAGGAYQMTTLRTEADAANQPDPPNLLTDEMEVPNEEGWDRAPAVVFQTDRAYPATVRSVQVEFDRGT